ncbi:anti-sigma factor [soil metagenome]
MAKEQTHNDFETLCSGYVLDALSKEDQKLFEEMLEKATSEQKQLYKDLQSVKGQFAFSVEPESPSPEVEDKIMQSIRNDSGGTSREKQANIIPLWAYKAAAAILLIGVLSLAYFTLDLTDTVDQQQAVITELQDQIERQDQLLNVLAAREVKLVIMGGLDPSPDGYGKILWDPENRQAVLQLANLPAPPEDKDYQLWLIKDEQDPISSGVFHFDQPSTDLFFKVEHLDEEPSPTANAFAVTLEPKGGMPQPTGDMFLLGQQE